VATLRSLVLIALLVLIVLIAAVFAYFNQGTMAVDVGFMRLGDVPVPVAFAAAFAFGWAFGLVTAGLVLLRMANDRRRLRRDLRYAEAEARGLRRLPLQDAN
jgi:uncharacterized integral membrane protein